MDDGPDKPSQYADLVFRVLAVSGLSLGALSGGYTISTTDDRIRRAEVEVQLQLRDNELRYVREELRDLKQTVKRIDTSGPAVGNKTFAEQIHEHEKRIDALERR